MAKKKTDPEYTINIQNPDGTFSPMDTLKGRETIAKHLSNFKELIIKNDNQNLSIFKIIQNLGAIMADHSANMVEDHTVWLAKLILPAGPLLNKTYTVELNIKDVFDEFKSKLNNRELMQVDTEAAIKAFHEYYSAYRNLWLTPITKQLVNNEVFTQKQVALICIYRGITIKRSNAIQYTIQYGLNSTESLFQEFTHFRSRQNRIGVEDSARKNTFKIKLLEKVVDLLDDNAKSKAQSELNILKASVNQNL